MSSHWKDRRLAKLQDLEHRKRLCWNDVSDFPTVLAMGTVLPYCLVTGAPLPLLAAMVSGLGVEYVKYRKCVSDVEKLFGAPPPGCPPSLHSSTRPDLTLQVQKGAQDEAQA